MTPIPPSSDTPDPKPATPQKVTALLQFFPAMEVEFDLSDPADFQRQCHRRIAQYFTDFILYARNATFTINQEKGLIEIKGLEEYNKDRPEKRKDPGQEKIQ